MAHIGFKTAQPPRLDTEDKRIIHQIRTIASCLGEIGTTPAFAANLTRDEVYQISCFYPSSQVFTDTNGNSDLLTIYTGQHNHGTAQAVFQVIDTVPQVAGIKIIHTCGQYLDTINFTGIIKQAIATGTGQAGFQRGQFLFQLVIALQHLLQT